MVVLECLVCLRTFVFLVDGVISGLFVLIVILHVQVVQMWVEKILP